MNIRRQRWNWLLCFQNTVEIQKAFQAQLMFNNKLN